MKKLLLNVLFMVFYILSFSQSTINNKEITIKEDCHYSGSKFACGWMPKSSPIPSTWSSNSLRILSFSTKFYSNCNYDLGNGNQKDWNKLMKISPVWPELSKMHSNRLGWRYNLELEQIQMAMFLHINHPISGNDASKRVYFPLNTSNLNVFNAVELIYSNSLMVTTVGNKSIVVKEKFFPQIHNTGVTRNAYFGGNERAPQDVTMKVENIKVDYLPLRFKQSDEKHFYRCKFYNGESLSYYAEDKIIAASYNSEARPTHSFFTVESGSDVTLISANEIVLDSNTHIQAGASFHAKIESCSDIEATTYPTTICNGDNLNFTINATSYELELQSIYGQTVYESSGSISGNNLSIDIPNLATAYYILRITFESPCDIKPKLYYVYVNSCTPPLANARVYTPVADSSNIVKPTLEAALSIYPNPTHDHIQVLGTDMGEYVLTDLFGRALMQGRKEQIQMELDVSDFPNGVYVFSINGKSERIVKQ